MDSRADPGALLPRGEEANPAGESPSSSDSEHEGEDYEDDYEEDGHYDSAEDDLEIEGTCLLCPEVACHW